MMKFLKFGVVGIANTAITIISYNILVIIGVYYIMANIMAYGIGVANSYYWNKNWVFQSNDKHASVLLKFISVNVITLAFNTAALFILVDYLHIHTFIAQVVATGIGMVINFFLNKKWTFESRD